MRENKNYRFVSFLPDELEKIAKKFKKFQNTIMGSFQAKIGWKRLRKRQNKNYRFITLVGQGREREKIKIIVPFRSYPTGNRKFQKNKKIKKYHYGYISRQNRSEKT